MSTQVGREVKPTKRELWEQQRRNLVREASETGVIKDLTPNQLNILQIRGYLEERRLRTFRELEEEGLLLGNTYQAASYTETSAFRRLEEMIGKRVIRREKTLEEEEFLRNNPGLPAVQVAKQLGRATSSIRRWRLKLGSLRGGEGDQENKDNLSPY